MVTRVSYQRARKKGPGTIHETDLSFLFLKRKTHACHRVARDDEDICMMYTIWNMTENSSLFDINLYLEHVVYGPPEARPE